MWSLAIEVALFPWQTVLFPGTVIPIRVSEGAHRAVVQHCVETSTPFGVVLVEMMGMGQGMLAEIGTLASIQDHVEHDDGAIEALGVGSQRFRILEIIQDDPFILAKAEPLEEHGPSDVAPSEDQAIDQLAEQFWQYAALALPKLPGSMKIQLPSDAVSRLNLICSALMVPLHQKQQLLEEDELGRRVEIASTIMRREITELAAFRAAMKILKGEDDAPPGPQPFSLN
ncbi:MAG: hypothetical protein GF320_19770 [Armatimonadia bacterium]|nr:hypothetical protein [Armatimonadia bacterium]